MDTSAKKILIVVAVLAVVGSAIIAVPFLKKGGNLVENKPVPGKTLVNFGMDKVEMKKFTSAEEFKKYISESQKSVYGSGFARASMVSAVTSAGFGEATTVGLSSGSAVGSSLGFAGSNSVDGNYSVTNVQVEGLDEPDSVKTDGKYIYSQYIAPRVYNFYNYSNNYQSSGSVQIIGASPANELKKIANIPASGEFLIKDNIVVVFETQKFRAFDITDRASPKEIWTMNLANYGTLIGARLSEGKLYVALGQTPSYGYGYYDSVGPCPFSAYSVNGVTTTVACSEIYHPTKPLDSSNTFTVSVIDITNGSTSKKVSFVGSYGSIFYMAPGAIYLSYNNSIDEAKFLYGFAAANQDFVPSEVVSKLEKLLTYDISNSAKMVELEYVLQKWMTGLNRDDELKLENELENRLNKYVEAHARELSSMSVVKIGLADFDIKGVGVVPGTALNQFSFDEYQGTLRVAATMGGGMWGGSSDKSVSDVYVLDSTMNTVGSVKDLGKGERIYAVRFVGDRGYVVTFRQTDPFYVLSFADPKNPQLEGELKIPGFSSYLEPLKEHFILGVGRENANVKLSLFDVTDPKNPIEKDKYELNEYWSEALSNHHAFMKNAAKQIFFLPGSQGGYFFSYAGDKLAMVKAVSESNVKRSLYIGDVFYIVANDRISSWDSTTWNKLGEVSTSEPTSTLNVYTPPTYNYFDSRLEAPATKAMDAKRMSDLKQIQTALELYFTDENEYPVGSKLTLGSGKAICIDSNGFAASGCKNPYMSKIPADPVAAQSYVYTVSKDRQGYTVTARLQGSVNGLTGNIVLSQNGIVSAK